jgi:hypothetical protein
LSKSGAPKNRIEAKNDRFWEVGLSADFQQLNFGFDGKNGF